MSTIVLVLNQNGIGELIQITNDIQSKVDGVLSSGAKPKDRIGDSGAPSTFLEVAKEKLPMILEEEEEGTTVATTSEFEVVCRNFCSLLENSVNFAVD